MSTKSATLGSGGLDPSDQAKLDSITVANIPSSTEKAALVGTTGTPSITNQFVTTSDSRMNDSRDPTAHATDHISTGTDVIPIADPAGPSGLLSSAWAALLHFATSAATALTLVLRDAAGRFKAADPSADDDVDTMGARNAALEYLPPSRFCATRATRNAGSYTTGISFVAGRSMSCIGAEAYWVSLGSPETITITLRDSAGTQLAQGTVVASSTGIHTVTWSSPVTLTVGLLYKVGAHVTSVFCKCDPTQLIVDRPIAIQNYGAGQGIFIAQHLYGNGVNVNITVSNGANEVYLVAPITR